MKVLMHTKKLREFRPRDVHCSRTQVLASSYHLNACQNALRPALTGGEAHQNQSRKWRRSLLRSVVVGGAMAASRSRSADGDNVETFGLSAKPNVTFNKDENRFISLKHSLTCGPYTLLPTLGNDF